MGKHQQLWNLCFLSDHFFNEDPNIATFCLNIYLLILLKGYFDLNIHLVIHILLITNIINLCLQLTFMN